MDLKDLAVERREAKAGSACSAAMPEPAGTKWLLLDSKLLDGEHILLVFKKQHLKDARQAHPGTVIYFPPEVEELKRARHAPETLKFLHRIKKEFGAWVVPSNHEHTER